MIRGGCSRLLTGVYWLALGTWLGAIVMLAVGAAVTFRTVRGMAPTVGVEPFSDPVFAGSAANVLAGAVVANMLGALAWIQGVCAAVVVGCLGVQWVWMRDTVCGGLSGWRNLLRVALIIGPIALLVWDRSRLSPTIHHEHEIRYDLKVSPDEREAARVRFDRYHRISERAMGLSGLMLAGAGLVSSLTLGFRR